MVIDGHLTHTLLCCLPGENRTLKNKQNYCGMDDITRIYGAGAFFFFNSIFITISCISRGREISDESLAAIKKKKSLLHNSFTAEKVLKFGSFDDIIIGSGMSGLSCAAILARVCKS